MSDFTYSPDFSTSLTVRPRVNKAVFGDGYQQRVADGINTKLESWNLVFRNTPTATADLIETFLNLKGGVTAFTWTNPNGVEITCVCEEWSRAFNTIVTSDLNMMFEEVVA